MIEQIVAAAIRVKQEKETLDAMVDSKRKRIEEMRSSKTLIDAADERISVQQSALNDAVAALKILLV